MVRTNPPDLPLFFDERPSGIPTRASTRQAVGSAKRRWNSISTSGRRWDRSGWPSEKRAVSITLGGQRFVGLVLGGRQFDGNVGLLESGDLIVVGVLGIGFVLGAVDQVQMQAVGAFADDNAFFRQSDLGIGGVVRFGHEDALPDGRALRAFHVLHVKDVSWEIPRKKRVAEFRRKPASL